MKRLYFEKSPGEASAKRSFHFTDQIHHRGKVCPAGCLQCLQISRLLELPLVTDRRVKVAEPRVLPVKVSAINASSIFLMKLNES